MLLVLSTKLQTKKTVGITFLYMYVDILELCEVPTVFHQIILVAMMHQ